VIKIYKQADYHTLELPLNFDHRSSMIPGDIIDLLHQLLLQCPPNIWHAIKTTENFDYNLQQAINLNDYQYETVLLASGLVFFRQDLLSINRARLQELQVALQENLPFYIE